jgi:hypothetical protein
MSLTVSLISLAVKLAKPDEEVFQGLARQLAGPVPAALPKNISYKWVEQNGALLMKLTNGEVTLGYRPDS